MANSPQGGIGITVVEAAAAAILTVDNAPPHLTADLGEKRYLVHPHIEAVDAHDVALLSYLNDIYSGVLPLAVEKPVAESFKGLVEVGRVSESTKALADALAGAMEGKSASAGILFGFRLSVGGKIAAGVIKADLDDEQRFHLLNDETGGWSIGAVSDILPPPRTKYAKFAIAPRPLGPGAAGIRDLNAETDSAAVYFLNALGMVAPKSRGTQSAVATAALRSGYTAKQVNSKLATVTADKPLDEFIEESFPDIPESKRAQLRGSAERPMPTIRAGDPYKTIYKTRTPLFELVVDSSVTVDVAGRTLTVQLPPGDEIEVRTR